MEPAAARGRANGFQSGQGLRGRRWRTRSPGRAVGRLRPWHSGSASRSGWKRRRSEGTTGATAPERRHSGTPHRSHAAGEGPRLWDTGGEGDSDGRPILTVAIKWCSSSRIRVFVYIVFVTSIQDGSDGHVFVPTGSTSSRLNLYGSTPITSTGPPRHVYLGRRASSLQGRGGGAGWGGRSGSADVPITPASDIVISGVLLWPGECATGVAWDVARRRRRVRTAEMALADSRRCTIMGL